MMKLNAAEYDIVHSLIDDKLRVLEIMYRNTYRLPVDQRKAAQVRNEQETKTLKALKDKLVKGK